MKILGIDTSTSFAGVGLSVDGDVSTRSWQSRHNHGREAMPAVMELLDAAGLKASELDAVAVALGPGGFSAVRVGIATAQGLVAPTKGKLIGVPTHLLQAYTHRDEIRKHVVSLIPVGRKQVSYCVFAPQISASSERVEIGICEESDVASRFDEGAHVLCGEGTQGDLGTKNYVVRPPEYLLEIALERFERDEVSDGFLEPIYSRPPTITAPRAS